METEGKKPEIRQRLERLRRFLTEFFKEWGVLLKAGGIFLNIMKVAGVIVIGGIIWYLNSVNETKEYHKISGELRYLYGEKRPGEILGYRVSSRPIPSDTGGGQKIDLFYMCWWRHHFEPPGAYLLNFPPGNTEMPGEKECAGNTCRTAVKVQIILDGVGRNGTLLKSSPFLDAGGSSVAEILSPGALLLQSSTELAVEIPPSTNRKSALIYRWDLTQFNQKVETQHRACFHRRGSRTEGYYRLVEGILEDERSALSREITHYEVRTVEIPPDPGKKKGEERRVALWFRCHMKKASQHLDGYYLKLPFSAGEVGLLGSKVCPSCDTISEAEGLLDGEKMTWEYRYEDPSLVRLSPPSSLEASSRSKYLSKYKAFALSVRYKDLVTKTYRWDLTEFNQVVEHQSKNCSSL